MQQDAPPIGGESVSQFKKDFSDMQNMPDVAEDNFDITVFGRALEEASKGETSSLDDVV